MNFYKFDKGTSVLVSAMTSEEAAKNGMLPITEAAYNEAIAERATLLSVLQRREDLTALKKDLSEQGLVVPTVEVEDIPQDVTSDAQRAQRLLAIRKLGDYIGLSDSELDSVFYTSFSDKTADREAVKAKIAKYTGLTSTEINLIF